MSSKHSIRSNSKSKFSTASSALPGSNNSHHDKMTYQENYEKTRKLLYSALVLKARDRLNEVESSALPKKSDAFWTQLETIMSRHEAQMDRVAQQAVELRSNLSSSRKSVSTTHSERMKKASAKLKAYNKKVQEYMKQIELLKSNPLQAQEEQINTEIDNTNSEIEQLNFRIQSLRKSTTDLKTQLLNKKAEVESRATVLVQKKKEAEVKADQLTDTINVTTQKINKVDAEIEELENREKICRALFESLQKPIPSIQRIFTPK